MPGPAHPPGPEGRDGLELCATQACYGAPVHLDYRAQYVVDAFTEPHPNFEIMHSEADASRWTLLLRGPEGSPYHGGTWAHSAEFQPDFPAATPRRPLRHSHPPLQRFSRRPNLPLGPLSNSPSPPPPRAERCSGRSLY